ncbi:MULTISPECIES: hypothetical protein [Streptomycetaceae]|uniref:DUF3168 domain-containing protein n=1 Tax=Streptantibioticus cattleyicolor (strain ATCC 35852 / DSM 46488 / JCM 4925 / NBRC 14057 / NRRL 8057) TaxID=1003195 RepID=F8JXC4_STREN|nr:MULTISPECIES: hypothetical protein [Streptomycetaceae]AEW94597.1 hypothetical protein SCATT_22260 [Streptantibioticus cattleyicolor NRRL 8057 = DSM 46488]MYS59235.1 hypothetical protein [Streptomyces sp. SID5468]CCB74954.1 protein of unknown function [Streptantibioticus cattleyicolor NRRL 8057 = DSM 46488]
MTTPVGQIPASSIPAARAYLLAQIQANTTADPASPSSELLVCLDEPGPYQPDDIISIGDVHQTYSPEATVGSGGSHWLLETYTITITVDVYRGGDDPAGVFSRARSLADLVVAVVRSDPSLGGAVDRGRPGGVTHEVRWDDEHKGRHCVIEIAIECLKTL